MKRLARARETAAAVLSLAALIVLALPAMGEPSAEEQHMRRSEPRPEPQPARPADGQERRAR